jgi:hypothetical protein
MPGKIFFCKSLTASLKIVASDTLSILEPGEPPRFVMIVTLNIEAWLAEPAIPASTEQLNG